ncbi:hypothetical protein GGR57DRAFT_244115 [Xylariaceae sp. FL1272]|nr:hypothetical protein GGR57DRAFT_244115 [Xylariaceae sp. FL1272]
MSDPVPSPTNPPTLNQVDNNDPNLVIKRPIAMLGIKSNSDFQGHAYIVLQVMRFCNVAVLLAVEAATVLMLIFAKLPNGYQFFADAVHALVFAFAGLLIFTEIGFWDKGLKFIESAYPMLGEDRGFTGLGAIMALIGCHLLGELAHSTYTNDSVPPQVPQVILGVGIVTLAFGIFNIIASFLFRNKEGNTKARKVRADGAISRGGSSASSNSRNNSLNKKISGPMPHHDLEAQHQEFYGSKDDDKSRYSGDFRQSPVVPGLERPPTAFHPAYRRPSTTYSEATCNPYAGEKPYENAL